MLRELVVLGRHFRREVVGNVDTDDLTAKMTAEDDELARHDPVPQDLVPVVDVVDETVQRPNALLQARFDDRPLVGRHDPGDRVERHKCARCPDPRRNRR